MGDIPSKDERESGVLYQHSVYPASLIEQVSAVEIKGVRFVKERTCHLVSVNKGYTIAPVCGECGYEWVQYAYCPNCGARVMRDE